MPSDPKRLFSEYASILQDIADKEAAKKAEDAKKVTVSNLTSTGYGKSTVHSVWSDGDDVYEISYWNPDNKCYGEVGKRTIKDGKIGSRKHITYYCGTRGEFRIQGFFADDVPASIVPKALQDWLSDQCHKSCLPFRKNIQSSNFGSCNPKRRRGR